MSPPFPPPPDPPDAFDLQWIARFLVALADDVDAIKDNLRRARDEFVDFRARVIRMETDLVARVHSN